MKEALFYKKEENQVVRCLLCPKNCEILKDNVGFCKVRQNIEGILYAKTYDRISAIALDPIEKKPLYNYKPGTHMLSVGTMGCNFKCGFCQNYHISQQTPKLETMTSKQLLKLSDEKEDSIGIAFTYNEPTVWYEYVLETAENNPKDTVLVTNGYINAEPLKRLLPYIDAMNIDLKSMNPEFYKRVCRGDLETVQNTIKTAYLKTHIELTFLAIPDQNDSEKQMTKMATWIANIDKNIPLHIIPFRPMYQWAHMHGQSYEKINRLKEIARKKLTYVY